MLWFILISTFWKEKFRIEIPYEFLKGTELFEMLNIFKAAFFIIPQFLTIYLRSQDKIIVKMKSG